MQLVKTLIIGLAVAACAAGVGPAVAVAGGYDVAACTAGVAGGANNSFYAVANSGMAAYTECPAGQGITARNGWDNGQSTWLEGAYMIFDAPSGNVIESIAYESGWQRHNCSWGVGLIAGGYDLGGTRIWGLPPGLDCTAGETPGSTNFFPYRWTYAINAPRLRIESRCGAGSCPRNGVAGMRIRNVQVRVRDDTRPSLTNGRGALWTSDGWLSGMQSIGFDAQDAAGVREATVLVDGSKSVARTFPCDYTRPAPCSNGGLDEPRNTAGFGADGPHTITLSATDAAGNDASVSRTVRIDNTAPDAPKDLVVVGGEGWRSRNEFEIRWMNAPQSAAPIAGAEYEVCAVAGDDCVRGQRAGAGVQAIEKLSIPAPGEYLLKVWLRDAAGNQDARLAATPVKLRYDDASPEVTLQPLTVDDPTRVVATTNDRGSGIASGVIEMRRQGAEQWTALATALEGSLLVARIDDEALGDGLFELRARAIDVAGNERSTTLLPDGRPAVVTLPVRLKTVLSAGVVRRGTRGTTLARSARVAYGQRVRVRGRVTSPEGNPLQDVEVQAFSQIKDGATPPRVIARVRTSRTGRFSFVIFKGPSRTIQVRYAGAPQVRGSTQMLALNVRSRTTLRPSGRQFRTGDTVRFSGKLATGRIPATGKLLEIQVRVRKQWRTFATTRTGPRGRWRYDYRFDGTQGRVVYKFRARIPRESGYPFSTGGSRVIRVRVRGV